MSERRPVLEVEDVDTYYGDSHVLQGVSLEVRPGEVLAILGRNGAGKTTLVRSIIGFTPPRSGRVRFKGEEITRWPPYRMVAAGMAIMMPTEAQNTMSPPTIRSPGVIFMGQPPMFAPRRTRRHGATWRAR